MAPERFSRFLRSRQRPSLGGDAVVTPTSAPTGATQPNSGSPSDDRGIPDTAAIETTRPGTSPSPAHVDVPVPVPTRGAPTPAHSDVQPTVPHRSEGSVDVPVIAHVEEVPSVSPTSRPLYRLDPAKAQEHVDRIRRFRILVMGRANAGKTTILQRVCNTTDQPEIFNGEGEKVDATVVRGSLTRGEHNIEDELVFQSNPRFVFHDSRGFEAGSEEQFNMMKKFVMDRAKTSKLDERIHAIWFCIPLSESHRMVTAAETKFFDSCDTGHVPVIMLATKADALELDASEQLEDQGLSVDDVQVEKLQKEIMNNIMVKLKDWLGKTMFPPHDYLSLTGMQSEGADCTPLLTCTTNALKEEGLQQLLVSTQQSNLELCMEFAIMKTLKGYMNRQHQNLSPETIAFSLSRWFPYPSISHSRQSLNIPTFSTSKQYSRQYIAENGIGAILVFEYLYFLLQVTAGRKDIQEDLNLAAQEYQSSCIHANVNKLIQEAFQSHSDNVEVLCPILVKIAHQNRLCKILFPY
ncbi:hypothetical protein PISMIDRAFT_689417 [Pisolithus microcarpus 441]|uniref:G domain-containing protein n=1 Tax=Pisolithus microcarpus 441 TaxID=765257 RepID=A0A0C9Y6I2_9AGAM|nr:hypothetical protein PISMIDRAFT_689417 [Pisolithus microcarpus 441]